MRRRRSQTEFNNMVTNTFGQNGGVFRCSLTGFFLALSMLYILYSSNLLLSNKSDCPTLVSDTTTALDVISTEENLTIVKNSSSPDPKREKSLVEEEEDKDDEPATDIISVKKFDTNVKHIVFGIAASSSLWEKRKQYISLWWKPGETRGVVWLDKNVRTSRTDVLPPVKISGDTSKFKYSNRQGKRAALRISRVVSETLKLGLKDVRWFVMGDDDTVFVVDNVVRVLSKYDHNQFYYIGSSSESHVQNIFFSYAMAYGGGGFAISYPLAKELAKIQDGCIQRYPALYGSDDRIQACMAELGVPLTKESGFHQYDVYGDLLGLLAAHPVTPLVSLHHLDVVDPIFPHMTQVQALKHLFKSVKLDSASIMQQSICYDKDREWSISVSWGYVVQVLRGVMSPRELEMPSRTFLNWYRKADYTAYAFNTRPVNKHPCTKPYIYYMSTNKYDQNKKQTLGIYTRYRDRRPTCRWKMASPESIDNIVVIKKPDPFRWQRSPRRDCCKVLPSSKRGTMYLWVGSCGEGEVSVL